MQDAVIRCCRKFCKKMLQGGKMKGREDWGRDDLEDEVMDLLRQGFRDRACFMDRGGFRDRASQTAASLSNRTR